jgi:hypothetical protein
MFLNGSLHFSMARSMPEPLFWPLLDGYLGIGERGWKNHPYNCFSAASDSDGTPRIRYNGRYNVYSVHDNGD